MSSEPLGTGSVELVGKIPGRRRRRAGTRPHRVRRAPNATPATTRRGGCCHGGWSGTAATAGSRRGGIGSVRVHVEAKAFALGLRQVSEIPGAGNRLPRRPPQRPYCGDRGGGRDLRRLECASAELEEPQPSGSGLDDVSEATPPSSAVLEP